LKFRITIKPKYLILITLTLSLILLIITVSDIIEGEKDIYRAKEEEAFSLLRTVQMSAENVFISNLEVEKLIKEKLMNIAYFIVKEEKTGEMNSTKLKKISNESGIDHIIFYSPEGNKIFSNIYNDTTDFNLKDLYGDEIDSLYAGIYDYFIPGTISDQNGDEHLSVIQKRYQPNAGYIVVSISSDKLLEFRKKIGIGNLLQKIAYTDEIIYVAIQDENGILTANSVINDLSSFSGDPFLSTALSENKFVSRKIEFNNEKIFEAVKPFKANNELTGVIRIGLSLKQVDMLIKRTIIRSAAISFLLLLTGVVLLIVITDKQNISLLKDEYRKIQTYTGNILDNMSDGVIATDAKGKINLMNPAAEKIFGFSKGEAVGLYCSEIIKDSECIIDKAIKSNMPVPQSEILIHTINGKIIILGGNADIIHNDDGSINTIVAVIKDITLQRNIEETQKRNEKLNAMGELAAGVAHEIKNPLNSIGITVQRFEKEFLPDTNGDEYHGMIKIMKSEIERVSSIIDQFLTFAKPRKTELKKIESSELLKEVYGLFYSRALKDDINFLINIKEASIHADSSQLKQALINIVQNAFESVVSGGHIEIESHKQNGTLMICIADNGAGISKENIGKIFNLYYTTKQTGSGLGLSIVNQIIAEHNGNISVDSKPGEGTKIILKIPLSKNGTKV
jgi:two-component system, NtrC family, sensor histidine kinase HydH